MITAPAARSLVTTAASVRGVRPLWIAVPFSVGMSFVSMMSFKPTGTPCRAPSGSPERLRSSAALACCSAYFSSRNVHAWTAGSAARICSRHACTRSSEPSVPSRIFCAASAAPRRAGEPGLTLSIVPCLVPRVELARQVQDDLRKDDAERVADRLEADERHCGLEDHRHADLGWRYALQVEQRIAERRAQEGHLHVDDEDHAVPERDVFGLHPG